MVGLARGTLASGRLSPVTIDVGFRTLQTFQERAIEHGADPILAVATSAVREAQNGGEFVLRVWERLGLHIDVNHRQRRGAADLPRRPPRARSARPRGGRRRPARVRRVILGESRSLPLGGRAEARRRPPDPERFIRSDPADPREISALEAHLHRALDPVFRRVRRARPTTLVGTSGDACST